MFVDGSDWLVVAALVFLLTGIALWYLIDLRNHDLLVFWLGLSCLIMASLIGLFQVILTVPQSGLSLSQVISLVIVIFSLGNLTQVLVAALGNKIRTGRWTRDLNGS